MDDFSAMESNFAVVGVGGRGSNLIHRLSMKGIKSADTIAVNTDAKHLNMITSQKKLLIGKEITRGLGAGGFPEVAAKCADASNTEITEMLSKYDLIFLAAGLGGGTGSGAGPAIARMAKEMGILVVSFVTYPFAIERSRMVKADWALEEFTKNSDTTIVIENDKLLSYAPNLPMERSFELIDDITINAVRGIADAIKIPSMINIDFADLKSVLSNRGAAIINIGSGSGVDKVEKAIKSTKTHPLMNFDMEGAKSALIHISAGTALTIDECNRVTEGVTEGLDPNANVILGARLLPELEDQIKVTSIITGVKPILGKQEYAYTGSVAAGVGNILDSIY
ncbi:MAG: cell division protein FtsZ [Candidatus Micrarchaeaceae archaeon]